jgi:hypothetical protein
VVQVSSARSDGGIVVVALTYALAGAQRGARLLEHFATRCVWSDADVLAAAPVLVRLGSSAARRCSRCGPRRSALPESGAGSARSRIRPRRSDYRAPANVATIALVWDRRRSCATERCRPVDA